MKAFRPILLFLFLIIALPIHAKSREKGWVALPDATLYYEAWGEGEPLIFVHGHSLDRRMWRKQVEYFRDKYRVICYDARGYGHSSKQREEVLFTHADDLIALMDALKIDRAHLVGLSMGGFIVGDMVAMYPERLLTATMAEGVIRSTPSVHEPMTEAEIAQKQASIDAIKAKGLRTYKQEWIASLLRGGSRVKEMRRPLRRIVMDWDGWQATHHEVHCYYAREAMEVLKTKRPTLPCLYIRAQRPNEATRNAPSMIHHTPNGEFVRIEDSGHMVNMEQPERFNEAVREFLERGKSN